MAEQPEDTVRLTANLPIEVANVLKELAKNQKTSMTEILRRAISLEKFANDTVESGGKILIEDKDKKLKQILIR